METRDFCRKCIQNEKDANHRRGMRKSYTLKVTHNRKKRISEQTAAERRR